MALSPSAMALVLIALSTGSSGVLRAQDQRRGERDVDSTWFLHRMAIGHSGGVLAPLLSIVHKSRSGKNQGDEQALDRERARVILVGHCESYLLLLPKMVGCAVCQAVHRLSKSSRYEHYVKRRAQLLELISMLGPEVFDPAQTRGFMEKEMCPFNGACGRRFYKQCVAILEALLDA